jgi:hypothetical protein
MAYGLTFRLELDDGTPADPPTFRSAPGVSWKAGDTIAIGRRTLRVLGVRDDDADQPPALVVEDLPGSATSAARLRRRWVGEGREGRKHHPCGGRRILTQPCLLRR